MKIIEKTVSDVFNELTKPQQEDIVRAICGHATMEEMSKDCDKKVIPVSELMNLYNEMYKVNTKTDGEREVLYTCRCMLADVIESYERKE